jgi:hypothetical protein
MLPRRYQDRKACYAVKLVRDLDAAGSCYQQPVWRAEAQKGKLCQAEFRQIQAKTGAPGGTKRLQGGGADPPETTPRSQAWTAWTTSSGSATARGVAEPAIQSEITVMRARNWPSASIEARTRKILIRREGLASSGIHRLSDNDHH